MEIKQEDYLNKLETEVELEIRFIASAIMEEIDTTRILLIFFNLFELSIESVTINFFTLDFIILSAALPLKTACVI
jgi:hypothetical protein